MSDERKVKLKNNDDIIYPELSDDIFSLDKYIFYSVLDDISYEFNKTNNIDGVSTYKSSEGMRSNFLYNDCTYTIIINDSIVYKYINYSYYNCKYSEKFKYFGNPHFHESINQNVGVSTIPFCLYSDTNGDLVFRIKDNDNMLEETIYVRLISYQNNIIKTLPSEIINNNVYYDINDNSLNIGLSNKIYYNTCIIGNDNNTSEGTKSYIFGNKNSITEGENSFCIGYHLINNVNNCICTGKYNDNQKDSIFEIGNGDADSSRSNAFRVTKDGKAVVQTVLQIGDTVVTEDQLKKLLALLETTEE